MRKKYQRETIYPVRIGIRLNDQQIRKIKKIASSNNLTVSQLVRSWVDGKAGL